MPKKMSRNKRNKSRLRAGVTLRTAPPHSVKELLARRMPLLKRVTAQAARERFWQEWLNGHIPEPLQARVCAIVERGGTLTIFAESPVWSARLRYAIVELESEIRATEPTLTAVKVRVLPRAAAGR